jgi:dTDP-4-amino-4,6-dideoxygalactose transaminase
MTNMPRLQVARPKLPDFSALEPYLRQIDQNRIYTNHGPLVGQLEDRLAALLGLPERRLVSCANGSLALIGAMLAMVPERDPTRPLCLMPAYSFVATAAAARMCGYTPYLVDINRESWALDPEHLRQHPALDQAGLVVSVAPLGRPLDLEAWQRFQEDTGIPVLIDAAAGFDWLAAEGTTLPAGLVITVSFHATKTFCCGEGGLIIAPNSETAMRCFRAINHGFLNGRQAEILATNGKMSEYHAAVALAELDGWRAKLEQFHRVSRSYQAHWPGGETAGRLWTAPSVSGCYAVLEAATPQAARATSAQLDGAGIDTRFWYGSGIQDHAAHSGHPRDDLSRSLDIAGRLLGLPVHVDMTDAEIARVARALG